MRRAFARRILDEFGERGQRGNILSILCASTQVAVTSLGANQCLRGALAFSHVRHVEPVPFDLSMQMLTPVLVDTKAMHLPRRIGGKKPEFVTILAAT
jgi:hypothetical protein